MATDDINQREQIENQVWSAIAAFEQIVETIPDDRVSLEALSHAYEQVGDLTRSRDYLLKLVNVIVADNDRDAAALLRERLAQHTGDPLVLKADEQLETLLTTGKPAQEFEIPSEQILGDARKIEDTERRSSHVATELAFAWTLFEANQLNQEEYAQIAQDLSEISSSQTPVTLSVLHVLHDRANRNLDHILTYAAKDSGIPVIPLSLFDIQRSTFEMLPGEFIVRYGAMVFELMRQDALVVILNPYNKSLRAQVEHLIGKRCHFFLTTPADFDATLEKMAMSSPQGPVQKPATP
jgi:hypothetical protein